MKTILSMLLLLPILCMAQNQKSIKFNRIMIKSSDLLSADGESFDPPGAKLVPKLDAAIEIPNLYSRMGFVYEFNDPESLTSLVNLSDRSKLTMLDTVNILFYKNEGIDHLDSVFVREPNSKYEAFRTWLIYEENYKTVKRKLDSVAYIPYMRELFNSKYELSSTKSISSIKTVQDEAAAKLAAKFQQSIPTDVKVDLTVGFSSVIAKHYIFNGAVRRIRYSDSYIASLATYLTNIYNKNRRKWEVQGTCSNQSSILNIELCKFLMDGSVSMIAYATTIETSFTQKKDNSKEIVAALVAEVKKAVPAANFAGMKNEIEASLTATWKREVDTKSEINIGKCYYLISMGADKRLEVGKSNALRKL